MRRLWKLPSDPCVKGLVRGAKLILIYCFWIFLAHLWFRKEIRKFHFFGDILLSFFFFQKHTSLWPKKQMPIFHSFFLNGLNEISSFRKGAKSSSKSGSKISWASRPRRAIHPWKLLDIVVGLNLNQVPRMKAHRLICGATKPTVLLVYRNPINWEIEEKEDKIAQCWESSFSGFNRKSTFEPGYCIQGGTEWHIHTRGRCTCL